MYTETQALSTNLDSIYSLLDTYKEVGAQSTDPLLNQQLRELVNGIYTTNNTLSGGSLAKPSVSTIETMTNSALISLLLTQIRKTNELVSTATGLQVKAQQRTILARNEDMMNKLKQASDAAKEAEKLSLGLDIFKWLLLALSVVLTVLSVIATACTFGAAAPVLAISATILAASIAMTIATSVPVNDQQNTAVDLMSKELSEAIAAEAKKNLISEFEKSSGRKWDSLSDAEQQSIEQEASDTGAYSSMAILITIQVIIAAAMIVATLGAGSGSAASYTVNAAASTTRNAVQAALDSAKMAIQNNLPAIQSMVRNISLTTQATKAVATIVNSGVQGASAYYTYESADNQADADKIKAYVKLLSSNNEMLIELIQQLNNSTAQSWEAVAGILKQQHATQTKIIALSGGNV
jgi:ABC-type multidrug transport system fused ATPase/permease subunit